MKCSLKYKVVDGGCGPVVEHWSIMTQALTLIPSTLGAQVHRWAEHLIIQRM